MKTIKVTDAMNEVLTAKQAFSNERVEYLTYTRNFYILENEEERIMTDQRVTLLQLQAHMNLQNYAAATLDQVQAEEALTKQPKTKKATPKKASAKKAPAKKAEKSENKEKTPAKEADNKTDEANE